MAQVEMTPQQLQELLKTAVAAGVSAAMEQAATMNPIEQRKFNEELARDRRRDLLSIELSKAETERINRLRNGCTHMRNEKTGMPIARGSTNGEWVTSGQAYQDGTAMVICQRCATTWIFKPTPEEYSSILQNGLLGVPPPPIEVTLCNGCLEYKRSCKCEALYRQQKTGIAQVA